MRVMLEKGAYAPAKAHPEDAGYDIRAKECCGEYIEAHASAVLRTGVHVEIPAGWCGQVWSRSGLHVRHGITTTGMIDSGYDGEVVVKLTNHSDTGYAVFGGDKIAQLVVVPCLMEEIEVVDRIQGGDRGSSGFGSTGR